MKEDLPAYDISPQEEMYACQRHNAMVTQFAFVMVGIVGFIVGVAIGVRI